ncbi:MAG: hypothetical protein ACO3MW_14055 [Rhodospirillales bacterium]
MRQHTIKNRSGFAMAAIAALGLMLTTSLAEAGGYKHKYNGKYHSHYYGKHYKKHFKHHGNKTVILGALGLRGWGLHSDNHYYVHPNATYKHRHSYKRYKRRAWKHAYNDNHDGSCYPVKKKGYWRGHRAKIGGTACVDRYGNTYIVKGSRYLIRYLY